MVLIIAVFLCSSGTVYAASHYDDYGYEVNEGECIEVPSKYLDTIEEYEEFFGSEEAPVIHDKFLTPEQLSFLGTFSAFHIMGMQPWELMEYSYTLELAYVEGTIRLYADHDTSHSYEGDVVLDISDTDGSMRRLVDSAAQDEKLWSIIRRDEMIFVYQKSGLQCVEWEQNGTAFRLWVSSPLYYNEEFPAGCFLDRLLSLDEEKFDSAKAELLALGASKDQPTDVPDTGDGVMLPIFLLCLSVGAISLLLYKKKTV